MSARRGAEKLPLYPSSGYNMCHIRPAFLQGITLMPERWRTPLRIPDWDYSQPAIYHITICIADRTNRLGHINNSNCVLSDAGKMVESHLIALSERFPSVGIDSYMIMPNHVHFIIEMNLERFDQPGTDLSSPVQALKSLTTRDYGIGVRESGWPPYRGILWQKRYFETIMRNERALERHRRYIAANPANWWRDPEALHRDDGTLR